MTTCNIKTGKTRCSKLADIKITMLIHGRPVDIYRSCLEHRANIVVLATKEARRWRGSKIIESRDRSVASAAIDTLATRNVVSL